MNNLKHLILGPCSAETEKQVLDTAKAISEFKGVTFFRAGIWKPRTRPNSFEGVGEIGLKWLNNVQETYNLKVITEVATPKQVEKCLVHKIDALWIGTRTTVNPFYVQEIAEVLKGVDIPIYIKNPITPDLNLWIGAIERFQNIGLKQITAIHRGFYSYEKQKYRNTPLWEIPEKLMSFFPELDIICDPSHIAGESNLVNEVSLTAMQKNMKGLMIETHLTPNEALSDKHQQITPNQLKNILANFE